MSKHFCCCLPVRFGVFVLSLLILVSAGAASAIWWVLVNGPQHGVVLEGGVKTGFIIAGVVCAVSSLFGLFGFIGAIDHNRGEGSGIPLPLQDLNDPSLKKFLLPPNRYRNFPLAYYSLYWKSGQDTLLEVGEIFRPNHLKALYCFKQYKYMETRIDSFREYTKGLDRSSMNLPGILILGTPGIGKTSFLGYYLARELSQGRPAIYISAKRCYIFNNGNVYVYARGAIPQFDEGFLHILCLVDADMQDPAHDELLYSSYPFVLMASLPRKANYAGWMKQRARGSSPIFVLNPPEENELVKALKLQSRFSKLSDEVIVDAIVSYGCNMRTLAIVLSGNEGSVEKRILKIAEQVDNGRLRSMVTSNMETVGDISHELVTTTCLQQPQPGQNCYRGSDVTQDIIAGHAAWNALLRAHGKAVYTDLIRLIETSTKIPQAAPSAGWLWGHWANASICKGGNFTLTPIALPRSSKNTRQNQPPDREETTTEVEEAAQTISVNELELHCFGAQEPPSATSAPTRYFVPSSQRNATYEYDAFFHHEGRGIGLQMTLGGTHRLNPDGLKDLYDRLQYPYAQPTQHWFVVVIRKGCQFKTFEPSPTPTQLDKFRFFTMELELPQGALPGNFDKWGERNRAN